MDRLFDLAVRDLRRGLLELCQAFIMARVKHRQDLIDQAVKEILRGAMVQASLPEKKGGDGWLKASGERP